VSSTGDVVIVNEPLGLGLCGQTFVTGYGAVTILFSDSFYQQLLSIKFGRETDLCAYLDFNGGTLDLPALGRVLATLVQLQRQEVGLGQVALETYQPPARDLVIVYTTPGRMGALATALEPELMRDRRDRGYIAGVLGGYPMFADETGAALLLRSHVVHVTMGYLPVIDDHVMALQELGIFYPISEEAHVEQLYKVQLLGSMLRSMIAEADRGQGRLLSLAEATGRDELAASPYGRLLGPQILLMAEGGIQAADLGGEEKFAQTNPIILKIQRGEALSPEEFHLLDEFYRLRYELMGIRVQSSGAHVKWVEFAAVLR